MSPSRFCEQSGASTTNGQVQEGCKINKIFKVAKMTPEKL